MLMLSDAIYSIFKEESGAKAKDHQDSNKRILIALAVSSTLLGVILLLLVGVWIYRLKRLKISDTKSHGNASGTCFWLRSLKNFLFRHISSIQFVCLWISIFFPQVSRGVSLGPILDKFTSLKSTGKKGSIAVIEYQLLVAATKNFQESNALGEGGLGRVYKAQFSDNFQAAVKQLNGKSPDAEREFEVNSRTMF